MLLGGLYGIGQGEGKGVTGTSPALPLLDAALYGVAVWGSCGAGLPWRLQGGCHSCPSPVIIWEGTYPCLGETCVPPEALLRLQGCASPSLVNRFSTLCRG